MGEVGFAFFAIQSTIADRSYVIPSAAITGSSKTCSVIGHLKRSWMRPSSTWARCSRSWFVARRGPGAVDVVALHRRSAARASIARREERENAFVSSVQAVALDQLR